MVPSFQPEGSSPRQSQARQESILSRALPTTLRQDQIISLEADVAGLVLQYEHTYGDRLRGAGWQHPSMDGYFELEALRNAGQQLVMSFTGGYVESDPFAGNYGSGYDEDFSYSNSGGSSFGRDLLDPQIEGFEVTRKTAYIKEQTGRADAIVLYEVKPDRSSYNQRWAFPDRLTDTSLEVFGPHIEMTNPVLVEVSCIDGEQSLGFIFSENAGKELIQLAMRDLERMPNEFLFGLKQQCLHSARKDGVDRSYELNVSDVEISTVESSSPHAEIIVEAKPFGMYQLKLFYDPVRSQVMTASRRIQEAI